MGIGFVACGLQDWYFQMENFCMDLVKKIPKISSPHYCACHAVFHSPDTKFSDFFIPRWKGDKNMVQGTGFCCLINRFYSNTGMKLLSVGIYGLAFI